MSVMQSVKLGSSGLSISKVIIGCMQFGSKAWMDWLEEDEDKVFKMLTKAYDSGIRTFDTANVYSNGLSEKMLGKWIKESGIDRSKIVILSKLFFPVDKILEGKTLNDPSIALHELINKRGLSRKNILESVEGSVERLGTYIDVLQIHRFDPTTPKKEVMKALNDVVESGKARYIGASSMKAVEFAELQYIADKYNYHKFISMQNMYNILYREEEREMIHFCKNSDFGKVGIIPYSPLARGVLARPVGDEGSSGRIDLLKKHGMDKLKDNEIAIVKQVEQLAEKYNVSMSAVAIAWLWKKEAYPIVGCSSAERIDEYLQASHFELTDEEVASLDEKYEPKTPLF